MEHRSEREGLPGAGIAVLLSASVFTYGVVADRGAYVLAGLALGVVAWFLLRGWKILSRSWLLVMFVSMTLLLMLGLEK